MAGVSDEFLELQEASAAGDLKIVRQLLDAGTDLNADYGAPRGWSPLMKAAFHGHLPVVQLLVKRGARLDAVEIDRWWTALDLALYAKRTKVADYLKSVKTPLGEKVPNPHRKGKLGGWTEHE